MLKTIQVLGGKGHLITRAVGEVVSLSLHIFARDSGNIHMNLQEALVSCKVPAGRVATQNGCQGSSTGSGTVNLSTVGYIDLCS